ncbi:9-hexadecenoic acid cis-trans isomerase [Vibrio sp. UCD-FRSSP16_10]|uniref:fatty acid cis/trans isomerase n=1 Tax=unclassified Vibrio TaxID=2614977 RepID=UPI0007FEEFC1|nr:MULTISPECIES: fatty acid cis/trans isomerase [unclassified Vibrio]OBT17011.1 9-hexadecenoic acid cis-trans isomerase [Vibrio sp. UCD-FRSSP16_30]OBT22002.1 9-hexadecenoic acid cis-trans isomerase [Vibrio sp. UCD-FRSSP16_10]
MRKFTITALIILFAGCSSYVGLNFNDLFGPEEVQQRNVPFETSQAHYFIDEIKPILDKRCVVCHACYDAPCQLKLTSAEGIDRGSTLAAVYQGERLTATNPTRLYEDASSTQQWREHGFYPVLNERLQRADANIEAGVMAQLLLQKEQYPLPNDVILDDDDFDFSLNKINVCPTSDSITAFKEEYPLWGMPYGMPALSNNEQQTLLAWLRQGATMSEPAPLSAKEAQAVEKWETYFNQDDLKRQITSRYIYEHLFLSHLYFSEINERLFFSLVRSSTPPGEPIQRISTRRPYSDPGVSRVYYRLAPERETIVDKTHMPYALNQQRMDDYIKWFDRSDYHIDKLPSYNINVASNPVLAFSDIPVESRYRFMLDEAQNTIMAYIKGPVCRGQLALNVINDHFWVFFIDPTASSKHDSTEFYKTQAQNMKLPSQLDSNTTPLFNWLKFSKSQSLYLSEKMDFMNKQFANGEHLDIPLIWNGDGHNPNAALTIFRHFDSASVAKGLVGNQPKTAWVIDYALLERIHYLLVAGFDIYGNFGHQLITRMYMDLLRIEGESNFIALLPKESRHQILSSWYEGQSVEFSDYLTRNAHPFNQESGVEYRTNKPKQELLTRLAEHVSVSLTDRYEISNTPLKRDSELKLLELHTLVGGGIEYIPQISIINIEADTGQQHVFTLLHNNAHTNISSLFNEEDSRDPDHDTLTLVNGILGSYPSVFLSLQEREIPELVKRIRELDDDDDYEEMLDKFAVRRTDVRFWPFSDKIHAWYAKDQPVEYGLLDYNRYENR